MDGVSSLSPERTLAAAFAATAAEHDRAGSFPHDNFRRLHEAGMLALTAPGGDDMGLEQAARLVSSLGEGCASTALVFGMQLIQLKLAASWPAAPRRLVADGARNGELVNALRVEPALGTPARGGLPATIARRAGTGWRISGHKIYSTGAPGLTWGIVTLRTDEAPVRMGLMLVPMHAPGVEIIETWDQLGLRASGSHDVLFHDVFVPDDHVIELREPHEWARPELASVAWNTMIIAALYTGVATAARDWLMRFLHERVPANLGASLATLPRMQEAVGAIEGRLAVNRATIQHATAAHDAGRTPGAIELGLIKVAAADNAIAAVEDAMKLTGNHGLSRANPLERHLRDVLCARVHTPQADAAHLAAGRALLHA